MSKKRSGAATALRVCIAHWLAVLVAVLPLAGAAQSVFRGENVLAFAQRLQANAAPVAVYAALDGMFEGLDIAADLRQRHAHLNSAQLQRVQGGARIQSVASTILLSAGSATIARAERALIIAEGDVEIDEARGSIVVARGRVRIRRETEPGIYVSRRTIDIDSGVSPVVYAVDGATVTSRNPFTAYNTAVKTEGGGLTGYKYTRAPLFQGEPLQAPLADRMQVNAGELMPFTGARCKSAMADDANVLSQMLPYARKRADCPKVESATVRCEKEEDGTPRSASLELWTLQLCGKPMTLHVQSKRMGKDSRTGDPVYDHSIVVKSGARPALAASPLPAKRTAFAGADALALTGVAASQLTRERVVEAVQRVFEALRLPSELRSKYAYMGSARLQVEPGRAELGELSESILVANGSVNIGYARNSIVIAKGPVEIAHGGGLIVIADGSVNLSHENDSLGAPFAPGVYVTRGAVDIGFSAGPVIYALRGSKFAHAGTTTYINTEGDPRGRELMGDVKYTVEALFSGEPRRTPTSPSPLVIPAPPSRGHTIEEVQGVIRPCFPGQSLSGAGAGC